MLFICGTVLCVRPSMAAQKAGYKTRLAKRKYAHETANCEYETVKHYSESFISFNVMLLDHVPLTSRLGKKKKAKPKRKLLDSQFKSHVVLNDYADVILFAIDFDCDLLC